MSAAVLSGSDRLSTPSPSPNRACERASPAQQRQVLSCPCSVPPRPVTQRLDVRAQGILDSYRRERGLAVAEPPVRTAQQVRRIWQAQSCIVRLHEVMHQSRASQEKKPGFNGLWQATLSRGLWATDCLHFACPMLLSCTPIAVEGYSGAASAGGGAGRGRRGDLL